MQLMTSKCIRVGIHSYIHSTHFTEHLPGAMHWNRKEHERDKNPYLMDPMFTTAYNDNK